MGAHLSRTLLTTLALALCASTALAVEDPPLPDWLDLSAEYRVQSTFIDPLELNGHTAERVWYTEQRLRLEPGLVLPGFMAIRSQIDLMDGVLFGDNGEYAGDPAANSGLAVTTRWPNATTWGVGLLPGQDPLDPDSYGPRLREAQPIRLNRLWGEVTLPFGLLRVGRQPITTGAGMNLHDGSTSNRWGVSRYSASADRVLFATKISEAFRAVSAGKDYVPNRSMDEGVFIGVAYDQVVEDDIQYGGDDLHQVVGLIQWKVPEPTLFGWDWHPFLAQVVVGGRFGDDFGTNVIAIPTTLSWGVGPVRVWSETVTLFGETREASEGFAALREADESRREIHNQELLAVGARTVIDVETGPLTSTLEFDFASGDADPRDETALTTYNFARDANVGLLLFEHILAFETARSVGVGIQNLANLGTASFPITELASEGRVHNAMVIFPQVLYRPVEPLGIRLGVLFAWAHEPVTDTIMTLLSEDGNEISDDVVNWHGGEPARYYGTELDLQVEWRYRDHFLWTVEGAVLFPGDALQDESGDAVTSFLVQNRFTFVF
jgi:hypothetical protein